mmetsp:Transcript_14911/g.40799  ORF Transcript_14911/g.40799 Transcript_14911/m.40799 type:complete len:393 (-) Transcript_14911:217-1395(-)
MAGGFFATKKIDLIILSNDRSLSHFQEDTSYFTFDRVLRTLSLRVAGDRALPYIEMMRRRERLVFYAQVAVVSKVALVYGRQKHLHDVQTNILDERERVAESNDSNSRTRLHLRRDPSSRTPAVDSESQFHRKTETPTKSQVEDYGREGARSTFCFGLRGRLVVVDAATGLVVVRAAPGTSLPAQPVVGLTLESPKAPKGVVPFPSMTNVNGGSMLHRGTSGAAGGHGNGTKTGNIGGANSGSEKRPTVDEGKEIEPLESISLIGAELSKNMGGNDRKKLWESPNFEVDNIDNTTDLGSVIHIRAANGSTLDLDFFDSVQALRFLEVARNVQELFGPGGEEHLSALHAEQVEKGLRPERDPCEVLAMRSILSSAVREVQRDLDRVREHYKSQ